jgi:hypothetical protein
VGVTLWNLHNPINGTQYFEEIGFTRGWHHQDLYTFYVAWTDQNGYFDYKLATAPRGAGYQHTYRIYRSSDPYLWILKLDDIEFYGKRFNAQLRSEQLQAGGEMSHPQSTLNSTLFSSLKYYFSPQQADVQDWDQHTTHCAIKVSGHWEWVSFPTFGQAWAP